MLALIERCVRGDGDAWSELWRLYEEVAARAVWRRILLCGLDPADAEDVAVEIYLYLREDRLRRLRRFEGASEEHLRRWLVAVALNFTRNWAAKRWRARRKERQALERMPSPDRSGPTEREILAWLEELERVASPRDIERLRMLASGRSGRPDPRGHRGSRAGVSEQTQRRWRKRLHQRYRRYL